MDLTRKIKALCQRYCVPLAFGEKLRPLLARAERLEPEPRQRILDLITRSFEEEARRCRRAEQGDARLEALPEADRKILRAVSDALHGWDPPAWFSPDP